MTDIRRGDICWADLAEPRGSEPGHRRPVLVVQADAFNRSRIGTVLCVVITSNLRLVAAPGNVLLPARRTGLARDSVANVSQMVTLDHAYVDEPVGRLPRSLMNAVESGLKLALDLV